MARFGRELRITLPGRVRFGARSSTTRAQQPCVLFFDELDALAYARSKAGSASARIVFNEFLTQLDGIGRENRGVLVLAATNMPWDVDPAMKRPGRFSRQVFVPPRRAMFGIKLADMPLGRIDFVAPAARTAQFSGADIDGVIELQGSRARRRRDLQAGRALLKDSKLL